MPELIVSNLHASYDRVTALRDVSMVVPHGGAVGVLGANGAGKSTLMNVLAGLHRPSQGTVTFDGEEMTGRSAPWVVKRGVALVPEGRRVFADMSVEDNLLLGGFSRTVSLKRLKRPLQTIFELFPVLHERRHQTAGTLSGGEQQMLAIGRGLMSQPTLLILDEPSLGLAPKIAVDVMSRLASLRAEGGLTVLLVEQNLHVAKRVVDHCVVLAHGSVVLDAPMAEVVNDNRLQAAYLGGAADKQDS